MSTRWWIYYFSVQQQEFRSEKRAIFDSSPPVKSRDVAASCQPSSLFFPRETKRLERIRQWIRPPTSWQGKNGASSGRPSEKGNEGIIWKKQKRLAKWAPRNLIGCAWITFSHRLERKASGTSIIPSGYFANTPVVKEKEEDSSSRSSIPDVLPEVIDSLV